MDEYWELLDEDRNPIGKRHRRGEPMRAGEYHLVVEVWTVTPDGKILLTLRAPEKPLFPNLWECTGGSALAGESPREAAVRELKEETGLEAREEELVFLGSARSEDTIYDIFRFTRHVVLSDVTLQEGETTGARLVTPSELKGLLEGGAVASPVAERLARLGGLIFDGN